MELSRLLLARMQDSPIVEIELGLGTSWSMFREWRFLVAIVRELRRLE